MFSDSHAHFFMIFQKNEGDASFLHTMTERKFRFAMDIGTEPGDLQPRQRFISEVFERKMPGHMPGHLPSFLHFAAGLWPHASSIVEPEKALKALKADIDTLFLQKAESEKVHPGFPFYCALGECGLDRFWNGPAAEKRGGDLNPDERGTADIEGEEFLFREQLKIAKEKNLSVIVHSREAYEDTIKCIDEIGHHKGIIHCYSYGLKEAYSFLERGWYISFPGNITYAKKQADKDRIAELVKAIPSDKLLLETDAPYLAPVPFRGKINTPLLIEYTYAAVSEILGKSMEVLAEQVYQNCCSCFLVK
ncbi:MULTISPECIES: TatD family hydrolase [unclassified Treponema]|uniref:TatD family hydrolase n=1 Tax=unclassified Treponema TaxID=2638727 RepID=UPI0020A613C4|nr:MULTISPECIES: TatD family hydrolase [unclassified Treponema]UTC67743.1 TatD family hydrolase [Treponema sp. OMZ 789]UTC70471.1 TatD family hydrolase [Treponema sp. OMZ 790]UTC73181.1 TatD family hydrolase [Treponema sp. OMZ 791]